jgi:hypothetical protein
MNHEPSADYFDQFLRKKEDEDAMVFGGRKGHYLIKINRPNHFELR